MHEFFVALSVCKPNNNKKKSYIEHYFCENCVVVEHMNRLETIWAISKFVVCWVMEWLKSRVKKVVVNTLASSWWPVINGVPQGSVLWTVLFNIFIILLEAGVECLLAKQSLEMQLTPSRILQRDLDRFEHWATINDMKFNKKKCRTLHLRCRNVGHKWKLGKEWLKHPCREGSGVLVNSRLSMYHQRALATKRANCILGYITHSMAGRTKEVIPLYFVMFWPHLECWHSGQTLKQTSQRCGQCPRPISV